MALRRIGTERDVGFSSVTRLSRDGDPRVRSLAASAMATVGKPEPAVFELVKILQQDSNADVLSSAVWAIGKRGPQAKLALAVLLRLLDGQMIKPHSEHWNLTINVIESLGSLGVEGRPGTSSLIKLVVDLRYPPDVRATAAIALGSIGEPSPSVREALELASKSTDAAVSRAAQESLAKLTSKRKSKS